MLRLTFESSLERFAGGWLALWGLKLTSELTIFFITLDEDHGRGCQWKIACNDLFLMIWAKKTYRQI